MTLGLPLEPAEKGTLVRAFKNIIKKSIPDRDRFFMRGFQRESFPLAGCRDIAPATQYPRYAAFLASSSSRMR